MCLALQLMFKRPLPCVLIILLINNPSGGAGGKLLLSPCFESTIMKERRNQSFKPSIH